MNLVQVNLQPGFGGGEIYTCFLGRAMRALGQPFDLVVNEKAHWWRDHDTGATTIHPIRHAEEIAALPISQPAWLIYHTPDRGERLTRLRAQGFRLGSFVHMPLYQRDCSVFREYDLLFAVSDYVRSGLLKEGLEQTYPEPLYGIGYLDRPGDADAEIVATSRYEWDTRKGRDRVLSWLHPAWQVMQPRRVYVPRSGLTLGVVSRITPIKQFPRLFEAIVPALRKHPYVNIELFGSGGYASVRDTRTALAPIRSRVRWWGQQRNVRRIYTRIDYLLTGLPEKEALGLNVIEAQICGTPVLAPDAPPFQETVAHGASGYLYPDPRLDNAAGFDNLMADLHSGRLTRPDPLTATGHLATFSPTAFEARVARLLDHLKVMPV